MQIMREIALFSGKIYTPDGRDKSQLWQAVVLVIFNFLWSYLFPWDSDCFNVQKCVFWFVGCLKLFPQPFSGFPIL